MSFIAKLILRLGIVVCASLSPVQEYAQQNLPQPIDAETIFATLELIEIVESLPLFVVTQEQVSFYDFDTQTWETYPFPEFPVSDGEIAEPTFIEYGSETYILKVDYYVPCGDDCEIYDESYIHYVPPRAALVRERYQLDRQFGKFRPFEPICGDHAQALPGEGEWVIFSSKDKTYICNTETGQTSAPLSSIAWGPTPALLNAPSLSTDNRWLVFTPYYSLSIFAYDFVESKLTLLGTMPSTSPYFHMEYPQINWMDEHRIGIENATLNYTDDHFYLFRADVMLPDSLQLLYHVNDFNVAKLDNPLRYQWVGRPTEGASLSDLPLGAEDCLFYEYEPMSDITRSVDVPGVCSLGMIIPDGSGDRLAAGVSLTDQSPILIRFDVQSGKKEEIHVDHLSWLNSISPDGRYVIVAVDPGDYDYHIAILDLQTKSILKPHLPIETPIIYGEWFSNRAFIRNLPSTYPYRQGQLFTVSGTTASLQTVKYYGGSPDKSHLLMESGQRTLDILHVETGEKTTIADIPGDMMAYAVWEDSGLINVTVWQDSTDMGQRGRWRIRLKF
jgi:hypothetical protein